MKTGKIDLPQFTILKKSQTTRWEKGHRHGVVKTHNTEYATHKWENNHNCRGSCKERMIQAPHQAYQPRSPTPGRQVSRTPGFEDQWVGLAYGRD